MEFNDMQSTDTGWRSWRAIKAAAGRPSLWVATWTALLLMGLVLALPWQAWFADSTSQRYAVDELLRSLGANFRFDHASATAQLDSQTAQSGAILALAAVLLGVFSAGGWLFLFLDGDDGPGLRRFLTGGARYFWRFLRIWLVSILVLSAWYWAFYDEPWDRFVLTRWLRVPEHDRTHLESLHSEMHVAALGWARDGIFALGFASVMTCATYARTRLAYFSRHSAVGAFLAAAGMILRRPIRTLRPMIGLFLFEALFVSLALGWTVRGLSTQLGQRESWVVVLAIFLVGQLAVLLRELGRGAKYHVAVDVMRGTQSQRRASDDAEPTSIGAPGGAQYPLDDDPDSRTGHFGATI